ncbi:MAG: hypothetical protein IKB86_08285 [Clostridia bacterium]|nr:hypothetical protein [Clostridia bacterium]
MITQFLEEIDKKFPLTKLDVDDYQGLKAGGMTFLIEAYYAKGLGHVSVMRAKGFLGLMKMDTLMISPYEVDLPLYSYDRIFAFGNDTLIVELYDTLVSACNLDKLEEIKRRFVDLAERDPGEHWYDSIKLPQSISKKGKKSQKPRLDALAAQHLEGYLSAKAEAVSDADAKLEKTKAYVLGLLEQGGPSTDVFKKELGEEFTKELFLNALFGIK